MVKRYDSRIYEKHRFILTFWPIAWAWARFQPAMSSNMVRKSAVGRKMHWKKKAMLCFQAHQKIDNLPIVASLNRGPVGYVGPRPIVLEQLQLLVAQLAVFHSYHDLTIIPIIPEEEKESWDWMRWLPSCDSARYECS